MLKKTLYEKQTMRESMINSKFRHRNPKQIQISLRKIYDLQKCNGC